MTTGLLLVEAPADRVARWAERGLVAARLVALGSWTAVQVAEPASRAADPYADALPALAARPLGRTVRPAVGFFDTGGFALVSVQTAGARSAHRWLLWTAATGARVVRDLPVARPSDLVSAAGIRGGAALADVRAALGARPTGHLEWLTGVHAALGLPGAGLLAGTATLPGEVVEPNDKSVRAFDQLVTEEARHQAELGGRA